MAIQDQCRQCTHYVNYNCTISTPVFNSSSCDKYIRNGISLEKGDSISTGNIKGTQSLPIGTAGSNKVVQRMFAHPFSFNGRIRRTEYLLSYLIYYVYCLPMQLMPEETDDTGWGVVAILWLILVIPMCWFMLAQTAKRCHDRGNSAWFMLLPFYTLWLLFAAGDTGVNQYGNSPK